MSVGVMKDYKLKLGNLRAFAFTALRFPHSPRFVFLFFEYLSLGGAEESYGLQTKWNKQC